MKKGVASLILVAVCLIGLFVAINSFFFIHVWDEKLTIKTMIQFDIYGAEHSLRASEIYMETAADYSVYQALYDTARLGGFCQIPENQYETNCGNVYWYMNDNVAPSDENILEGLDSCARNNLNVYVSEGYTFMDNYDVVINPFVLHTTNSGNGIISKLSATMTVTVSKPDEKRSSTLKKNIDRQRVYEIDYPGILNKAKEKLDDYVPAFLVPVQAELDQWPVDAETGGLTFNDMNHLFSYVVSQAGIEDVLTMEEAESQIRTNLLSSVDLNFESEEGDFTIRGSVVEADIDVNGDCLTEDGVVSCDGFVYTADVDIKVEVFETNGEELPVFNGEELAFEPIIMTYLIKETYTKQA